MKQHNNNNKNNNMNNNRNNTKQIKLFFNNKQWNFKKKIIHYLSKKIKEKTLFIFKKCSLKFLKTY
jgi:hypothetical protein